MLTLEAETVNCLCHTTWENSIKILLENADIMVIVYSIHYFVLCLYVSALKIDLKL